MEVVENVVFTQKSCVAVGKQPQLYETRGVASGISEVLTLRESFSPELVFGCCTLHPEETSPEHSDSSNQKKLFWLLHFLNFFLALLA